MSKPKASISFFADDRPASPRTLCSLLSTLLLLCAATVFAGPAPAEYQSQGTRSMAQRLEDLAAKSDPRNNLFLSDLRAEMFKIRLNSVPEGKDMLKWQSEYAAELLNAGRPEDALREFLRLGQLAEKHDPAFLQQNQRLYLLQLALSHLRRGEQDNCLTNHSGEACLLPFRAGAVHRDPRGSQAALAPLTELLHKFPGDLEGRWLLNIAHMTLGQYPDGVPAAALIPPSVFASEYNIKPFANVAAQAGLDVSAISGGSVVEDFDGDGLLDVLTSSIGPRDRLHYFRNNGDGTFTDRTFAAGLRGLTGGLNLIQADYNNDGRIDVLVLRGAWFNAGGRYPNSLLRNNGNGTFDDVTEAAGLLSFHPTQAAVWLDYDRDGWIDLFIGNETTPRNNHACELYRNNRDGTFTEVAAEAGVAIRAFVKGVAAGDFNNDGWPDLYLSILGERNILLKNEGLSGSAGPVARSPRFSDVTPRAGVGEPIHSFPTWFFDYDNDGWLDLYVGGYKISGVGDVAADYLGLPSGGERPRLYRNNGDGTFADVTRAAGLHRVLHAMGANFGDLDNDGWLDFYLGTGDPDLATLIPNRMFRNDGGKRFQDVTSSGRFGHLQKGHGISFADLDNDGDQDIHEDMGGAYSGDIAQNVLFENPGHGHRWITLQLEGASSSRDARGARVKVTTRRGDTQRDIHRTVGSGGSFGASPLRQEIGLGDAEQIVRVEITWPRTGQRQTFSGLDLDRFYRVRENENRAIDWKPPTFRFGATVANRQHHQHHH